MNSGEETQMKGTRHDFKQVSLVLAGVGILAASAPAARSAALNPLEALRRE